MTSSCAACGGKGHTAWHPDCKICQKEKEKALAKLASMASRYLVRSRVEQNRAYTSIPVNLDSDSYQIVTCKRKGLGELAEATLNIGGAKTKPEKQNRPSLTAKLAEKEPGQQTIQFSSPMTKFTGTSTTPEQVFRLILEVVRESADASMETTLSSL